MNRQSEVQFQPNQPLVAECAHPRCRAIAILPARNEEETIAGALDALAGQIDHRGALLASESFEILLLLNNCTDGSATAAERWKAAHPKIALHIVERDLAPDQAHVGTARRLLMDTAWQRLQRSPDSVPDQDGQPGEVVAILSTDSDTHVAPDWIARNLAALERGADAVGGAIRLREGELELLPAGARRAYLRDRRYQRLVAELEDLLDPQEGDPWPRHLEHFGASLACTPQMYARAGGLPAVKPLEDVAFVNALRQAGAKLRHDPNVVVYTSSRMEGRAEVGLSGQLSLWQQMSERGEEHRVLSAAWLMHRFRSLRRLRELCAQATLRSLTRYPEEWRERLAAVYGMGLTTARFLGEIDCDRLIEETFRGEREGEIVRVNRNLKTVLRRIGRASPSDVRDHVQAFER